VGLTIVLLVALVTAVGAAGAAAQSGGGWDVSFPQCAGSRTVALPQTPTIGVVGVNNGAPFSTNPCLASQIAWSGLATQVYMNTDDPGPGSRSWPARTTRRTPTGPRPCVAVHRSTGTLACAYDYGWRAARDAYLRVARSLRALGAPVAPVIPMAANRVRWWLDVEAANTWSGSLARNTASIAGSLAYLHSVHAVSVGIYANRNDSHTLFVANSSWFPQGTLTWLATGSTTQTGGLMYCGYPGFTRTGYTWMVQFWPSSLDADAQCAGYITGGGSASAGQPGTGARVTLVQPAPQASTISLTTSTPTGQFSTSASGPWTHTLSEPIAQGQTAGPQFVYRDTHAGTPTLSASVTGVAGLVARYTTVAAGPLSHISVTPTAISTTVGSTVPVAVTGTDAYGNPAAVRRPVSWSVSPQIAGSVTTDASGRATFHPAAAVPAQLTAVVGTLTAHVTVAIAVPPGAGPGTISGPAGMAAGTVSGAMAVRQWVPAGAQPVVWTVAVPGGAEVATSALGPWSSSAAVTVSPGQISSGTFVVRDTVAGSLTISATATPLQIVRTLRVGAGRPMSLQIRPPATRLPLRAGETLSAVGQDRFGNVATVGVHWAATPRGRVSLSHLSGPTVRVTARRRGAARITATTGALSAIATVRVP
jgi:hypothetical protein